MQRIWMVSLLAVTGCGAIADFKSTVEGLTERFVIEGLYLGSAPFAEDIDLSATGFDEAKAVVFLADASQISEIDQAPLSGLEPELFAGSGGVVLEEGVAGKYSLSGEDGLVYGDNQAVTLEVTYGEELRAAEVYAPAAADLDAVPTLHAAGASMTVDLSGQGFTAALVVVMDADSSEVTHSNEPQDIEALYELTHPDGIGLGDEEDTDDTVIVEIPSEAFPEEGIYVIGIAGLETSGPDDLSGINTALSTFVAGKFRFVKVCTDDYAKLCAG